MDEQIRDGWAAAAVRVEAEDAASLELPSAMKSAGSIGRNPRVIVWEISPRTGARLELLLHDTKLFLREHEPALARLREVEIDLFLGWSPRSPQESLEVDAELIAILSRLNASVVFDTYSE